MAQINVSVNTETKEIAVTIDGVTVPNVDDVSCYSYRDSDGNPESVSVSIYTQETAQNGMTKRVTYYSTGSKEATEAIANGLALPEQAIAGFVAVEDKSKLHTDIANFLSKKRR